MSGRDKSGSAFPISPGDVPYWEPGMTLREWYAGQALPEAIKRGSNHFDLSPDLIAKIAFSIADAMLAEGAK